MTDDINNFDEVSHLNNLNSRKNITGHDVTRDSKLRLLTKYEQQKIKYPNLSNEDLCKSINSTSYEMNRIKKDLGIDTSKKYDIPSGKGKKLDPNQFGEQYKNLVGKGKVVSDDLICVQCGKNFKNKSGMLSHIRSHNKKSHDTTELAASITPTTTRSRKKNDDYDDDDNHDTRKKSGKGRDDDNVATFTLSDGFRPRHEHFQCSEPKVHEVSNILSKTGNDARSFFSDTTKQFKPLNAPLTQSETERLTEEVLRNVH